MKTPLLPFFYNIEACNVLELYMKKTQKVHLNIVLYRSGCMLVEEHDA